MRLFRATEKDVFRIKECAEACCAEHGEERMGGPLNWDHYRTCLRVMIERDTAAMWLYEDDLPGRGNKRIVAGICGHHGIHPLTGLDFASRVFIYVLPEYRGKVSILRLVRLYENWARERGCRYITQSWLDTMPQATEAVYAKLGYRAQETIYLKRL